MAAAPRRSRGARGPLEALVPWLAALALAARLLATAARRVWPHVRDAARAGAAGCRRATRAAARGARQATAAARPVLAEQVRPRVALAATVLLGAAVLAASRLGDVAEQALTEAGVRAARRLGALADLAALAALVWLPRTWRWVAPRLPGVARRTGQALAGVLAAALLVLPAVHVAALAVDVGDGLPELADRSVVLAADGSTLAILRGDEDRRVVPLERIPAHVQQAVLAAEDRRFRDHPGYDLRAIGRAAAANLAAGRVREGASTITQQLAKRHYTGGDRTFDRKVRELVYAVALEDAHSKDELLEHYLNGVYFGGGAHGVAAAAWEYFRAAPEDLTVDQAALLASQIRSPSGFDPRADPAAATARRNAVLDAMAATGAISPAERDELAAAPVELAGPRARGVREPYVVEAIRREFLANPAFGSTEEERQRLLLTGGLVVRTTIVPALQSAAGAAVERHLQEPDGPTAALAAVEPVTGRVLALHGGRDFTRQQFDLATQARRQPGSTFKTFAAAAALEAGWDPAAPLPAPARSTIDTPGGPWTVRNHGGAALGELTLEEALAGSVNTAFAALAVEVGTDALVDVLARVGVDPERALGPPATRGPAIALGGVTRGVSPLELAAAYGVFGADGAYAAPHLIERVGVRGGRPLYEADAGAEPALDPAVAGAVARMLVAAVEVGTGTAARLPDVEVAGKTGTTQQGADAWFAGVAEGVSAAVWVGHPDGRTPMPGAAGGELAAPIWRDFVAEAVRR